MLSLAELLTSEWLITLAPDGRATPRLARRWTRSTDGRDWTFELPESLSAHGNNPADASTIAELLRSAFSNPMYLRVHPGLRDVVGVSAIDKTRLIVRSRRSRALMLDDLADLTLKREGPDGGFGPFEVQALSGDRLDLRAFAKYFRGTVGVAQVSFRTFASVRAAWSALMRNELDALYEVGRDAVEFFERDPRVRVLPFQRPYASALLFNVSKPVFASADVRKGLSHAVDRQAIVRLAYRGHGRAADGPLWPEHWALAGAPTVASHDPHVAAKLLGQLSLRQNRNSTMPSRLRFTCIVAVGGEQQPYERIALLLQRQFFAYGIEMNIEPVAADELIGRITSGRFDAALFEFLGRTPGWMYGFWHSQPPGAQGFLQTGYSGADGPLQAMQSAKTDQELRSAIHAAYARIAEDPPAIFIAWPQVSRAVSTDFVVPDQKGVDAVAGNLWLWRPAAQNASRGGS